VSSETLFLFRKEGKGKGEEEGSINLRVIREKANQ
jgi:hypothetical protein